MEQIRYTVENKLFNMGNEVDIINAVDSKEVTDEFISRIKYFGFFKVMCFEQSPYQKYAQVIEGQ